MTENVLLTPVGCHRGLDDFRSIDRWLLSAIDPQVFSLAEIVGAEHSAVDLLAEVQHSPAETVIKLAAGNRLG